MRTRFFLVLLLLNFSFIHKSNSQSITSEDNLIFSKFSRFAKEQNLNSLSISERIPVIGSYFLESPYVAGTLDEEIIEELIINLRGLDCVTFVEVTLALAFVKDYNYDFINDFVNNLVKIRYRNGNINYTSRLHYSTDWLYEMEQKGLLKNVTSEIGGQLFKPAIYYMSKNSSKYPQLKDNKRDIERIKEVEKAINSRVSYFIPKSEISSKSDFIENGDIILITTSIEGLDTSHLGIAVKKEGKVYLLHASSSEKKVVITEQLLEEYVAGVRNQTGIIVARAIN